MPASHCGLRPVAQFASRRLCAAAAQHKAQEPHQGAAAAEAATGADAPAREVPKAGGDELPPALAFEVADVEGKGSGLVAVRDIARGELLLAEAPAIVYNSGVEAAAAEGDTAPTLAEALDAKFATLPAAVQGDVMNLHDACVRTPEKSLEGIVYSNAFSRGGPNFDAALCVIASRLNHSCMPNVDQSWDHDVGQVQVFASRDIAAGEELCNTYVDLFAPADQRQSVLLDRYRFRCTCPACTGGTGEDCAAVLETSNKQRRRLGRLMQKLKVLREKGHEGGARLDPYGSAQRAVRMTNEALSLMDKENIQLNCDRKVLCRTAQQLCTSVGDKKGALAFLELSYQASVICHEEEHRDRRLLEMELHYAKMSPVQAYKEWSDRIEWMPVLTTGVTLTTIFIGMFSMLAGGF